MRFLLSGVGNHLSKRKPTKTRRTSEAGASQVPSPQANEFHRTEGGRDHRLPSPSDQAEFDARGSRDAVLDRGGASGTRGGAELYRILQGTLDNALRTDPVSTRQDSDVDVVARSPPISQAPGPRRHPDKLGNRAGSRGAENEPVPEKQKRGKKKGSPAKAAERADIGAGRALFGGFVPSRKAPAASLYDFGDSSKKTDGGVSALGSIYGNGAGKGVGGGTLETLDDAKVRQYTQEATVRAQRLGAEKRSSRISRSKRQG